MSGYEGSDGNEEFRNVFFAAFPAYLCIWYFMIFQICHDLHLQSLLSPIEQNMFELWPHGPVPSPLFVPTGRKLNSCSKGKANKFRKMPS